MKIEIWLIYLQLRRFFTASKTFIWANVVYRKMKSPTKRIFYHLEVTRGTFDTEMSIRARYQHVVVPARAHPRTLPARRRAHPYLPTCKPAVRSHRRTQKSLVAERYQAFSEAKSLS